MKRESYINIFINNMTSWIILTSQEYSSALRSDARRNSSIFHENEVSERKRDS